MAQTVRLRWFLLVAATVAVATCSTGLDWWRSTLVYQIYPRSFKDSDGDGIGDLNGITEKLSYLAETGVDAIWMSPIYLSPMYDFGYDITDYRQIAPEYGTMEDFNNLMKQAMKVGIRVILDFVPNHTSNESDWFVKSANKVPGYENYYVWANGTVDPDNESILNPPNNWISIFRKSAWEFHPAREQFYLHQFVIGQPDLNYRDENVQREMKDVIRFWLDKGVSGFRVDAINVMYEVDPELHNGLFPDEPLSNDPNAGPGDYDYLAHPYTKDQDETYDVVYSWRQLLDDYIAKDGEYKLMMTEAYTDMDLMMRYYGKGLQSGSIPFNFVFLGGLNSNSNANDVVRIVNEWMTNMPNGRVANWVNGNHDNSRLATRHGVVRVDAMNMLALLLPGVSITYQGEELGMTDGFISWEDTVDPQSCNTDDPVNYLKKSRDPERTPFHWDASANAGFSNSTRGTWLPVADNYRTVNLAVQQNADKSHYKFYRDVAYIKRTETVRAGSLDTIALSTNVVVVKRLLNNEPSVIGVANLSNTTEIVSFNTISGLPPKMKVAASGIYCTHALEETVTSSENIEISPNCAMVLTTTSWAYTITYNAPLMGMLLVSKYIFSLVIGV